jgi:hypothetical protein
MGEMEMKTIADIVDTYKRNGYYTDQNGMVAVKGAYGYDWFQYIGTINAYRLAGTTKTRTKNTKYHPFKG